MNRSQLEFRSELLRAIRDYFYNEDVLEVTTATLRASGSSEIHLDNIQVGSLGYLQTSPEHAMKCIIAEQQASIFQICPAYRGGETGKRHRLEFQMLEWYRCHFSLTDLMDDLERLLMHVSERTGRFGILPVGLITKRYSYRELFERYIGVNPHTADIETLAGLLAPELKGHLDEQSTPADYLDAIFSHHIEPALIEPAIVFDYPACQAALAETKRDSAGDLVSDRFELFVGGVEIANAYQELGDRQVLERRFTANNEQRALSGKAVMGFDNELLEVIDKLPKCAGIALGIDRLAMVLMQAEELS